MLITFLLHLLVKRCVGVCAMIVGVVRIKVYLLILSSLYLNWVLKHILMCDCRMSILISPCVHLCLSDGLSSLCLCSSSISSIYYTYKWMFTSQRPSCRLSGMYMGAHTGLATWPRPLWDWCKTPLNWAGGSWTRKLVSQRAKGPCAHISAAWIWGDDQVGNDGLLGGGQEGWQSTWRLKGEEDA